MVYEQLYFDFYEKVQDTEIVNRVYQQRIKINLENISSGMEMADFDEIDKRAKELEAKGFGFLQGWSMGFYVPDRMYTPSGDLFDLRELKKHALGLADNQLKQQEALDATEYWGLVDSVPYSDERHGNYLSFLNEEDERNAREKYNKPKPSKINAIN